MAYIGQAARATTEPKAETYHMLELFGDVLTEVDRQYVTPVDDKKLIQSAMEGMLTSLDPHSDYLTADAYNDLQDQTRGEYGGLGLEIQAEDGAVKVISPIDGTPAARGRHQAWRLHHRGRRRERARRVPSPTRSSRCAASPASRSR